MVPHILNAYQLDLTFLQLTPQTFYPLCRDTYGSGSLWHLSLEPRKKILTDPTAMPWSLTRTLMNMTLFLNKNARQHLLEPPLL